jgi:hypothetical protein
MLIQKFNAQRIRKATLFCIEIKDKINALKRLKTDMKK